ncbi:hypothetical protein C8R45DRAFT_1108534 [Mycena sanguinolenta]|nr:hypothetical protein C8R45DRAFT_1108534 [Mycena sanguinolenta]
MPIDLGCRNVQFTLFMVDTGTVGAPICPDRPLQYISFSRLSRSVTETLPFLPVNTDADNSHFIATQTSHTPPQASQTTVHSPRTAAIAASAVTAIVVFTLALVLIRLRRHKSAIRQRRIPEQFLDSREHIVQMPPAKKGTVPIGAESAEANVNESNSVGEAVLYEIQLKHPETLAPRADSESVPFTDSAVVGEEERAAGPSGLQEAAEDEETMSLRVRR